MVLDYLTQLNEAAFGDASRSDSESSGDEESQPPLKKSKVARPKIEVRIANRKKGVDENGNVETRRIRFPKATPSGSARPLAQLFNVLDVTHEALLTGIPTTKRDVFYKDVGQFGSQGVVDQLVDDIAATWDLQRSDLNIRAASKGLVAGSGIAVHLISGETLTGNDTEGMNIPVGEDIESFSLLNDVKWIIVVEKEAVFQTLCRLGITNHEMMPVYAQGKGYPDVATRHLIKSLADGLDANIPIVALVDCDAFGLDILSVYRYGSKVMQHENDHLATRRIKWLGLRTSEMSGLGIDYDSMLPISKHDEKKILAMLQRPNLPKKWKMELMRSLHLRRKAEIEIISASSIGEEAGVHPLLAYLSAKTATMV
ncbi:DNA topoisomerase IV, alpha subunit [Coprinellus micaceus]|uniref:DNA topoisomerase (ATP-hydrolyzing) n=1 Tax=Coprinellus micaceus TaxID=71717 RepID=A0A4Y7TTR9_COPMI|nr:DNA topoisomerase IV, alpha subunit [Coprinellus micaceus]